MLRGVSVRMDSIARAALALPEYAIVHWPGSVGRRLRAAYWKRRLGAMGEGCIIEVGVQIPAPEHVFLGDRVWIDCYSILLAGPFFTRSNTRFVSNPAYEGKIGQLTIGSNTHVAPFCVLQAHAGLYVGKDSGIGAHSSLYSVSNHYRAPGGADAFEGTYESVIKYSPLVPEEQQAYVASPIVMEDASGVAVGSLLLPGATVGRYTWVAPGSVVRGRMPRGVIAGGNPAAVVKQRFGEPIPQD